MLWLSALFSVVKIFKQGHAFMAVCVRKEKSLSGFFPWWFLDNWLLFVVAHEVRQTQQITLLKVLQEKGGPSNARSHKARLPL